MRKFILPKSTSTPRPTSRKQKASLFSLVSLFALLGVVSLTVFIAGKQQTTQQHAATQSAPGYIDIRIVDDVSSQPVDVSSGTLYVDDKYGNQADSDLITLPNVPPASAAQCFTKTGPGTYRCTKTNLPDKWIAGMGKWPAGYSVQDDGLTRVNEAFTLLPGQTNLATVRVTKGSTATTPGTMKIVIKDADTGQIIDPQSGTLFVDDKYGRGIDSDAMTLPNATQCFTKIAPGTYQCDKTNNLPDKWIAGMGTAPTGYTIVDDGLTRPADEAFMLDHGVTSLATVLLRKSTSATTPTPTTKPGSPTPTTTAPNTTPTPGGTTHACSPASNPQCSNRYGCAQVDPFLASDSTCNIPISTPTYTTNANCKPIDPASPNFGNNDRCASITPGNPPSVPGVTSAPTTQIAITLRLHGIGSGGDAQNPGGGNPAPKHTTRLVSLQVFDSNNQPIQAPPPTTFTYDSVSGSYKGTVDLGSAPTGLYTMTVKTSGYLKASIPGIVTLTSGTTTIAPPIYAVAGDLNDDDQIDTLDYNAFLSCIKNTGCAQPPTASLSGADLNDDGIIDITDNNLFLREISVRQPEH